MLCCVLQNLHIDGSDLMDVDTERVLPAYRELDVKGDVRDSTSPYFLYPRIKPGEL